MGCYLITGIAGFIGSALARVLITQGHEVIGFDNLKTGLRSNVPAETVFYEGDAVDPQLYIDILPCRKFDAIFHLAGPGSVAEACEAPVDDLRISGEATLRLLEYALATKSTRVIFASSKAVYGDKPDMPVSEDDSTRPESFYGVGKLAAENYLRVYARQGIRPTCLRLFNVYGPGQNLGRPHLDMVSAFMRMMLREKHIHIQGSPNRYRDFVYIDDAVSAFLACLERPASEGRVFNIGGTGKVLVGDLVDKIASLSFNPPTVEYSGQSAGDVFGIHADISLAAKYLGYDPEVDLHEGLDRMYAWMSGQES